MGSVRDFKPTIAQQLVTSYMDIKVKNKNGGEFYQEKQPIIHPEGHVLLENKERNPLHCFVCKCIGDENVKTSIYSCCKCQAGFHVNCFMFYHNPETIEQKQPNFDDLISQIIEHNASTK